MPNVFSVASGGVVDYFAPSVLAMTDWGCGEQPKVAKRRGNVARMWRAVIPCEEGFKFETAGELRAIANCAANENVI